MTGRDWILIGWGFVAAGLMVWIWRQVKRSDDALEANEALQAEMRAFNSAHRPYTDSGIIPLPRADVDADYESFMLDSEHPHPHLPKAS